MVSVQVKKGEQIDFALKRLKNRMFEEGTLEEVYRRRTFENTQEKKKRKQRSLHKKNKYSRGQF